MRASEVGAAYVKPSAAVWLRARHERAGAPPRRR